MRIYFSTLTHQTALLSKAESNLLVGSKTVRGREGFHSLYQKISKFQEVLFKRECENFQDLKVIQQDDIARYICLFIKLNAENSYHEI